MIGVAPPRRTVPGRIEIVTAAASAPVTLSELKDHLRQDGSAEDTQLTALITVATAVVEAATGLHLVTRTSRAWYDAAPGLQADGWWPADGSPAAAQPFAGIRDLILPARPWTAVASVTSYDDAGTATVMAATSYLLTGPALRQRLVLAANADWPASLRPANAIAIQGSTGFSTVPSDLKQAVLMAAAYLYTHRGDACGATPGECLTASGAAMLLAPYRLMEP